MSDDRSRQEKMQKGVGALPVVSDLLSDPQVRERFEQTSAALEVADLVRRMRRQALSTGGGRGISQLELAERTGISQPRISQIEKGSGRDGISYAVLRKIAYACGIDAGQLLREAIKGPANATEQVDAGKASREATFAVEPTTAAGAGFSGDFSIGFFGGGRTWSDYKFEPGDFFGFFGGGRTWPDYSLKGEFEPKPTPHGTAKKTD